MEEQLVEKSSWYNIGSWMKWSHYSDNMLRSAEKLILSYLKSSYKGSYIDIGSCIGSSDKIWTLSLNSENKKTPLVLLHGLGAGSALFVSNFDVLSQNRPVYAIDLPGFARSSRSDFAKDALVAEKQFVKAIEEWRKELNIPKMILLGHSFGGFLGTSYALEYPERVQHLILADPWGFPEKPKDTAAKYNAPLWVKAIAFTLQPLNPLWALRVAGPYGQWVVEKTRPDIMRKYSLVVKDDKAIAQYIHQCNVQSPTGESAFHSMMSGFGWAKHPMINRVHQLKEQIPLTIIYGSRSWVDSAPGDQIRTLRPNSYVNVEVINMAGHHVYVDKAEEFNEIVLDACNWDVKKQKSEGTESDQERDVA